jgi:hypothetical protein
MWQFARDRSDNLSSLQKNLRLHGKRIFCKEEGRRQKMEELVHSLILLSSVNKSTFLFTSNLKTIFADAR